MLKFEAIGRVVEAPLFPEPKPDRASLAKLYEREVTDEELSREIETWTQRQDVKLDVSLVSRSVVRRWAYAYEKIKADNRAKIRELRKTVSPEDNPALHDDEKPYAVEECALANDELMREAIETCAHKLHGVQIDGVDPKDYATPRALPTLLDHAGLLSRAFTAVLKAQTPTKREVFY